MTNIQKDGWKKSYITKWFQEDEMSFLYFMSAEITAISLSLCVCVWLYTCTGFSELNTHKKITYINK